MLDKAWTRATFNICVFQNPLSPNERLSKGYSIDDIKASAHASHKTHACISLKQRGYSRNYGLVYNLGKQMAVSSDKVDQASNFANELAINLRANLWNVKFFDNAQITKIFPTKLQNILANDPRKYLGSKPV